MISQLLISDAIDVFLFCCVIVTAAFAVMYHTVEEENPDLHYWIFRVIYLGFVLLTLSLLMGMAAAVLFVCQM
jgi:hypothetical protein